MIELLTNIEWTTCWMAIRYAMGRQTISSSSLPTDLVKAYGMRWTANQMDKIYGDLSDHMKLHSAFGNKDVDDPEWTKFMNFLNYREYLDVVLVNGEEYRVFKNRDTYFLVDGYLERPDRCWYLKESEIVEKIKYNDR